MKNPDSLDLLIERPHRLPLNADRITLQGKFSLYEETHTGTEAGWFKFRKDIKEALQLPNDSFNIEVKSRDTWYLVTSGTILDKYLDEARKTQVLHVRIKTPEKGIVFFVSLGSILTLLSLGGIYYYASRRNAPSFMNSVRGLIKQITG